MTIKGLTDRGMEFPCIGTIRKGGKKTQEDRPGPDLDYFRVEFDEIETVAAENFHAIYGDKPKTINIIFPPHRVMEDIASFWLEAYTAGRMVARSDGEIYTYLVDTATGEAVVINGETADGKKVLYDPKKPCGFYTSKKTGKQVGVYCKPVGRLKVVIPELRRAAWLSVLTSSKHDCMNLSSQIQAYLTDLGNIAAIPFLLKRSPRMISTPDPDDKTKRVRREKSLLSIEVSPAWFGKLLDKRSDDINKMIVPGQFQPRTQIASGLDTSSWENLHIGDEDEELQEDESVTIDGEIIPETKTNDYADLDLLSERDAVTAFWQLCKRIGMDLETSKAIVAVCGNNFKLAYEKAHRQAPPI
jgi:hypothetical protein